MQEPRKKFEFQPNSDRNTLAGKPVQWATTQAPDPRYASVSPSIVTRNQWPQSSGLQQKVEQFASYATPPQVSDKPWSIAETPTKYGGASKIWQIAWFNTQIAPWVKSFQEDTDFVYKPKALEWQEQQIDTSINFVLSDLKTDIDNNNTIDDLINLYPDVPKDILPDLYTDIKNGTSLLEIKSLSKTQINLTLLILRTT